MDSTNSKRQDLQDTPPTDFWISFVKTRFACLAFSSHVRHDEETARDALHRIEQDFDYTEISVKERMRDYEQGERDGVERLLVEYASDRIWFSHAAKIADAPDKFQMRTAEYVRDQEIVAFESQSHNDPDLLNSLAELTQLQAGRAAAVQSVIDFHRQETLERLGLRHDLSMQALLYREDDREK